MLNDVSSCSYQLAVQHRANRIAQQLDSLHIQFEQLTGSPYTPSSNRLVQEQQNQTFLPHSLGNSSPSHYAFSDCSGKSFSPTTTSPKYLCRSFDNTCKDNRWGHCISPRAISSPSTFRHAGAQSSPVNASQFVKSPRTQDENIMTLRWSHADDRHMAFSSASPRMNHSLQGITGKTCSIVSNHSLLSRTKSLPSRIPRPKKLSSNVQSICSICLSCSCHSLYAHRLSKDNLRTLSYVSSKYSSQGHNNKQRSLHRPAFLCHVNMQPIDSCTDLTYSPSLPAEVSIFDKMNAQAKQDIICKKNRISDPSNFLNDDSSDGTKELAIEDIRLPSPEKEFTPERVSQYTLADIKRLGRRNGRRESWR